MKRFKRTVLMGIPIGLVLLLLLLMAGGIPILAQAGGSISGHVAAPITSGSLIPPGGTIVRLIQPGSDLALGQATVDAVTGDYSFPVVDDGLYFLQAVPPAGGSLTPSQPESVMVSGNAVTVNLLLTRPQVFGTVAAPNGSPAEAVVSVFRWHHKVQQTATSGGQFKLGGLPMGNYTVQASPVGTDPYWKSMPVTMTIVAMPGITTTTRLTMTAAQLWGTTQDSQAHPVAGAMVAVTNISGTHRTDFSNADGFWTLGNLPDGEYWLEALPPADRTDLLTPPPFTVTLPGAANPFTLTFSQTLKQAHGTVRTNTGAPVQNALVVARRVNRNGQAETHTAGDGTYQIDLSPGLWALTVKSISGTVPADWVYADPPALLQFARDTVTQTRQQDFTVLTADGTVTGTVLLPTGSPPPFKVTIGLYNDEGVGVRTIASTTTGQVSVAVPHGGYKVVVHAHNPAYLGPAIDPIDVPANGTVGLGTMTLLLRNAVISGTLTDNNSDPVSGVPVVAWRAGVPGSLHTLSGPNGRYVLFAAPGTWQVRPAPGPVNPYIFTGAAATVVLADGQHLGGVDFSLVAADATISGSIIDSNGNPAGDVGGWVTARSINPPHIQNGAPISNSVFAVSVPAGTYNVLARLSPGGDYVSTGIRQVTVGAGETVDVSLVVETKDAAISGEVYDARNTSIPGINGVVAAWQDVNWAAGPIAAGLYRLNVAAGLWHFDYRLDPTAGYAKLARPRSVAVESGQDKIVRLPVALKDGLITGTVKSPDGSALGGALVVAKGFSDDVDNLWLKTLSQSDGSFSLAVPYGNYRLGAVINNRAWLKPLETTVSVPQGGASGGYVLQFRQPNATLGGTVTVSNTTVAGPVFVWAWSDDGAFSQRVVTTTLSGNQATGPYQLNVLTGTTWHVGARFETGSAFWRGEATVSVDSASVTQNVVLTGPNAKPGPVAVLFNAADEQSITLADGTEIYIPAGAMPVSGDVLLRIVPLAAMPNQADMRVVNYGYAFLASDSTGQPIEEHFNQDVTVRFAYDDTDVLERWLKPAYYSTTTNEWTFPESYVVDTAANEVTMQIDHFTDFALLDTQTEPALSYTFNTGRDGWLVFGDANGGSVAPDGIALPNYSATGGFPGGYVYAVDEVTGGTWYWMRRFTDTVDVSTAYSRTLSFALRQTYLDSQYRYRKGDIILEGGTGITATLTHRLPFHPLRVWTPYWIRLHKSAHWIARRGPAGIPTPATEADFMAVLGNLKSIKIRGEYRDGGDTGSLDNVIVGGAPAPSMQTLVSHLTGGRLVFTSSTVSRLDFPPGMASEPFTVTVSLTDTSGITNVVGTLGSGSMITPEFRPVGPAFIIEARRPNGSLLMNFNRPFTITIRYDAGEADGLDEPGLSLYYRGSAAEQWQVITTTHGTNVLTTTVDHLTQFAVLGATKTSYSVYLPLIMR